MSCPVPGSTAAYEYWSNILRSIRTGTPHHEKHGRQHHPYGTNFEAGFLDNGESTSASMDTHRDALLPKAPFSWCVVLCSPVVVGEIRWEIHPSREGVTAVPYVTLMEHSLGILYRYDELLVLVPAAWYIY